MAEYVIQSETLSAIADAIRQKKGMIAAGEYVQLEYIESTGTQYIDTGYYITSENLKIVARFALTELKTWAAIWGVEGSTDKLRALTPLLNGSNVLTFYSGSSGQLGDIPVTTNTVYSLTCQTIDGAITYECNETQGTATTEGTLCKTDSFYVFTLNSARDDSVIEQASKMRLYSFQMYDNEVLVRDFVPAAHTDGALGLYDLANDVFYTNAGTGVFTAGAEIETNAGSEVSPIKTTAMAEEILALKTGREPVLQEKSVAPSTSAQTVTPDSGYDGLSKVTVSAMKTATQATPGISVSSSGLITASATQTEGYVSAGTKSATKQLTTQAAQTITPGTTNKTIASDRYLIGTQTIEGDADLLAENIKKGVSIFGVTGTFEGSGGGSGGGLPAGVSALTFGTFTPTSDCTSDWPIYHDLGQTPNFYLLYTRDAYDISDLAGYYFMQAAIPKRVLPEGAIILGSFVSASNMINTTMSQEELMTTMSRDLFVVDAASSRKLKAGVTYNWMCGVIDMGE